MEKINKYLVIAKKWINNFVDPVFYNISKRDQLEFETKIDIKSEKDLEVVFGIIHDLKIIKAEHRSEFQHLFKFSEQEIIYMILIKDTNEIWLKVKIDENDGESTDEPFPMVKRKGVKYKPKEEGYREVFEKISESKFIYSFHKECLNYYFQFKGYFFSLSISLVFNQEGFRHTQMEFEYEGYAKDMRVPKKEEILLVFSSLFKEKFPMFIGRLNSRTKYQEIIKRHGE